MRNAAAILVFAALVACGGGGGGDGDGGTWGPCAGAQGLGGISNQQHNLLVLNAYRACAGVPPLALDGTLSAYALVGSQQYAAGGPPHGHFMSTACPYAGPCAENQGWSFGQPTQFADIDTILLGMWNEGPGGGHYDNITNPAYSIVGIGIVVQGGTLYLTNDFQ